MNKLHQTLLVVAAAGGLLSALLSLYGQAHYVSRQEWAEEIKANEAAHRSIGDSLADIRRTSAILLDRAERKSVN